MRDIAQLPNGKWEAWHMVTSVFLGQFDTEIEATRASMAGTSVSGMFEDMLAQDLFTDSEGNPIVTRHLARK